MSSLPVIAADAVVPIVVGVYFVLVPVSCAVICILKGKWGMAALIVAAGIYPVVGAVRLAKPGSFWARRFYDDEKNERAEWRSPALKSFAREVRTDQSPADLSADLERNLTRPLRRHGYTRESQSEGSLTFVRTTARLSLARSGAKRPKYPLYIQLTLEPHDSGTLLKIAGEGPGPVRQAFATMAL